VRELRRAHKLSQERIGDQAVLSRGATKPSMIGLADLISSSLIVCGIPG